MNTRTKRITLGAMLCALEGVLLFLNRQLAGALDIYLIWVVPLPLIVYSSKYGFKAGVWVSISLVLLSFIVATPTTIFYVAGSALLGTVYGYGVGKGKSNAWLWISAILGSTIVTLCTSVIFAKVFGYNIQEDIAITQEFLAELGLSLPKGWSMKTIVYAAMAMTGLMEGTLIHMVAYLVLRKLKIEFPQFSNFLNLRLNKVVACLTVLIYIGFNILVYIKGIDNVICEYVYIGIMPFVLYATLAGYLSAISCLKMIGHKYAIILIMVSLFIAPGIAVFVLSGWGILDSFIDFRKKLGERYAKS